MKEDVALIKIELHERSYLLTRFSYNIPYFTFPKQKAQHKMLKKKGNQGLRILLT